MSVSFLPGHVSGLQTALSTPLSTLNDTAKPPMERKHWGQYKFSCCVLCKEIVLFFKVQDLYLVHTTQNNVASTV